MSETCYKILLLEDSAENVERISRALAESGIQFELECIDTENSFIETLQSFRPDIIIADYFLPGYDGLSAFRKARDFSPYIPFIICTDSVNEEAAVECMKAGADDYVLKDRIVRLGPAVRTVLEKTKIVNEKRITGQSRDFYQTLFEKIPGMIWQSDINGEVNYVNQSLLDFTGRTFEEEMGWNFLTIVHREDRKRVEREQREYIRKREAYTMEYRLRHKSGAYRWIIESGRPYEDMHGRHTGFIGICYDIHERRMAEEQVLHINRLYSVLSHINQTIVTTKDDKILLDRVCQIAVELGELKMAWIGIHDTESDTIKPIAQFGDRNKYLTKVPMALTGDKANVTPLQTVLETGGPYIINSIMDEPKIGAYKKEAKKSGFKSSGIFPVKYPDGRKGVLVVNSGEEHYFSHEVIQLFEEVVDDISFALKNIADEKKRVEAERSLQESEERFRTLVQSMDDIVFVLDTDQRHVGVYGRWLENFDVDEGIFLGKTAREILGPESAKVHQDANKRAFAGEHVIYNWTADTGGEKRYMQTSLSPLRDASGKITGVVGVGRDVTDLREAQEIQRIQSAAVESAANAIVITDTGGIIQSVNYAFTAMTGYERDEVIGKKTNILRSSRHGDSFYTGMWKTILSGSVWSGEVINKRKDGSLYTEEMTITPVRDPAGNISHFVAIKQDITQQKQLQHHVFQTQKMESIGTLASGIAHDFNNILGIIIGYAGLLQKNVGDGEKFRKNLDAINKAVSRGANLVQQILTFARKTEVTLEIVRVNGVINELVQMLEETFPKTISLDIELGKKIPPAVIDQGQLHQALLNLCVNARDAIEASDSPSGTISIKTRVIQGTRLLPKFPEANPDKYIEISIVDTGSGMDEKTVERIFEPFFTTKEKGKGTGLGLSVVYGIVSSYKGFIDVQSEPGKGTAFMIYLPVRPPLEYTQEDETHAVNETEGGNETILFIEDEELLRDAILTILEDKGYSVIFAKDGPGGFEAFSKYRDNIDIVVSDIGLPGMNGMQVYRQIKTLKPDIPYIVASGYFDPATKKLLSDEGVDAFVRKPYQPNEMLLTIRNVLDNE